MLKYSDGIDHNTSKNLYTIKGIADADQRKKLLEHHLKGALVSIQKTWNPSDPIRQDKDGPHKKKNRR